MKLSQKITHPKPGVDFSVAENSIWRPGESHEDGDRDRNFKKCAPTPLSGT